jgi:hypothetical protein
MNDIEKQNCGNCLFFYKMGSSYICRRHPPVVMMMPNENNTITDWPRVIRDDWCGEYNEKK